MVKPYIAVASLVGGILSAGLAIWIAEEPSALTSPAAIQLTVPDVPVVPAVAAQNTEADLSLPVDGNVISVDPMLIFGPQKAFPKPVPEPALAPDPTPAPQLATDPCSDWRELGPKSVETVPGAMHKVRQLCVS